MQVLLLDTLETAPTIAASEMRAATTLLRLALCCRFKYFEYQTIGASASVVVVVTVVVVLVMVSVVVIVVAAAVVIDILLFGCESRSASDRPCEWLPAIFVGAAVVLLVVCVVVLSFAVVLLLLSEW